VLIISCGYVGSLSIDVSTELTIEVLAGNSMGKEAMPSFEHFGRVDRARAIAGAGWELAHVDLDLDPDRDRTNTVAQLDCGLVPAKFHAARRRRVRFLGVRSSIATTTRSASFTDLESGNRAARSASIIRSKAETFAARPARRPRFARVQS
jgi:hypothetical protein